MAGARKSILCIEDDRELAILIAGELATRGFAATTAQGGEQGLLAIMKATPDLVLCAADMASMAGLEVLQRLAEIAPSLRRIPFVFIVEPNETKRENRRPSIRAVDYVNKPIDFDQLTAVINAQLVSATRTELNRREIQALTWVARGATSADIARKLKLSKRTIDFHVHNARIKLHARTRTEAVHKAVVGGLIKP
jgi:DNA-binding NarL/FixJ family response regulator